jgi:LysM repeat protein
MGKSVASPLIKSWFIVSLALFLSAPVCPAGVGDWNYIGTLGMVKMFDRYGGQDVKSPGFCTFHMLDYQPLDWLAAGLGAGFETVKTDRNADGRVSNDFVVLTGRLLPVRQVEGMALIPYLVGGAGVNAKLLSPRWSSKKHLMGGAGCRFDLDRKPGGSGIDLQVMYTGFTPDSLEVRLGYSAAFGIGGNGVAKAPKAEEAKSAGLKRKDAGEAREAKTAKPSVKPAGEAASARTAGTEYVVKKGDSLWKIAGSGDGYGKPADWPNIYRANKGKIKDPNLIRPDQQLDIPEGSKD